MRKLLKVFAWTLGAAVLLLGAWFGINATDEALSADAQAALRVPPPPAPGRDNGFIDFLALGAPADAPTYETGLAQLAILNREADGQTLSVPLDPRIPRCKRGEYLTCVTATPDLRRLIDEQSTLLARYRAMRDKPRFIDLAMPRSPEDPLPAYQGITNGERLLLMRAALDFNAGRRAPAIAEIEAELAFHRKVARDTSTLITKMIAFAMLDATAVFAAEVARELRPNERALWARLQAAVRPPTLAELDLLPVMRRERAQWVEWMRTRKHVRMPEEVYETFRSFGGPRERPWWDAFAPYLYRPHQSVNKYVAQQLIYEALAKVPARDYEAARVAHRARAEALEPPKWQRVLLNPVGHGHYYFTQSDFSDYIGRMHALTGVQSLVALQVRLRAAGITRPAEVEKALAGPLGRAYPDPFSGEPMIFEPGTMSLGFACEPKLATGAAREALMDGMWLALRL